MRTHKTMIREKAVETTNGHGCTRIRTGCGMAFLHPRSEPALGEAFVFIDVHSWFENDLVQVTPSFRMRGIREHPPP
jgi:hypothetical protein